LPRRAPFPDGFSVLLACTVVALALFHLVYQPGAPLPALWNRIGPLHDVAVYYDAVLRLNDGLDV